MTTIGDPKPRARIRDAELMRRLHLRRGECVLFDSNGCVAGVSLHHVHRHPRDDVEANLVFLCGSGTTGHHGKVEHHESEACAALQSHLRTERPDTMEYLADKLGGWDAADEWLRRYL